MLRKQPIRSMADRQLPVQVPIETPPESLKPSEPSRPMVSLRREGGPRRTLRFFVGIAAFIGLLTIVGVVWFFFVQVQVDSIQSSTIMMPANEFQSVVDRVGTHIQIKADERPTVSVIEDVETLKGQDPLFYEYAKNGDRLLIWSDKAVLFSATENKILAVLPIRIPAMPASPLLTATTATLPGLPVVPAFATSLLPKPTSTVVAAPIQESAVIEVRNGTRTTGLAQKVADTLKAAALTVSGVATGQTVAKTTIIVREGKVLPTTVAQLIQLTGGVVGTLPAGEKVLTGDILVIVGPDYLK